MIDGAEKAKETLFPPPLRYGFPSERLGRISFSQPISRLTRLRAPEQIEITQDLREGSELYPFERGGKPRELQLV